MDRLTLLKQAWVILGKPLMTPEDIIEVRRIINEEIQAQIYESEP